MKSLNSPCYKQAAPTELNTNWIWNATNRSLLRSYIKILNGASFIVNWASWIVHCELCIRLLNIQQAAPPELDTNWICVDTNRSLLRSYKQTGSALPQQAVPTKPNYSFQIVYCESWIVHCALWIVHYELCIVHCESCIIHRISFTSSLHQRN